MVVEEDYPQRNQRTVMHPGAIGEIIKKIQADSLGHTGNFISHAENKRFSGGLQQHKEEGNF